MVIHQGEPEQIDYFKLFVDRESQHPANGAPEIALCMIIAAEKRQHFISRIDDTTRNIRVLRPLIDGPCLRSIPSVGIWPSRLDMLRWVQIEPSCPRFILMRGSRHHHVVRAPPFNGRIAVEWRNRPVGPPRPDDFDLLHHVYETGAPC